MDFDRDQINCFRNFGISVKTQPLREFLMMTFDVLSESHTDLSGFFAVGVNFATHLWKSIRVFNDVQLNVAYTAHFV